MVSDSGGPGVDAQSSGAHALHTIPLNPETHSQVDPEPCDLPASTVTASQLSESLVADDFLTDLTPRAALPVFWRALLPTATRNEAHRMYVRGDGSCGTGAVLLAVSSPDAQDARPLAQTVVHSPRSVASFRTHEIKGVVSEWSEEHWCALMPMELRDEVWDDRPTPKTYSAQRSPRQELRLFLASLDNPFCHSGNAYFFVVTRILQMGLILITDDRRLSPVERHLHDFGSEKYELSMVIYSSFHRGGGTGHYETVGLFPLIQPDGNRLSATQPLADTTQEPATLFTRSHWLLVSLRAATSSRTGPHALDAQRINVTRYSEADPTMRATVANVDGNTPSASRRRPRRTAVLPHRYRSEMADGPMRRPPAARSLSARLDATLAPVHGTNAPLGGASVASAVSRPRPPNRPEPPETAPSPVAAAPRPPQSTRLDELGARALSNISSWLREHSSRNAASRMPSRVHRTAIPMWTNQCRAVLQNLAVALQQTPMDETAIVGHLCVLWMLPMAVFSAPGRARGGTRGRRSRINRIHHALGDSGLTGRLLAQVLLGVHTATPDMVDDLCSEMEQTAISLDAVDDDEPMEKAGPALSAAANVTLPDVRAVQRAEALMRAGHSRRALQALSSTTAKADLQLPTERARLQQLHPVCPNALPACPADAPAMAVDLGWMSREMSASDTGAAPGPSGWGSNHLEVLATDTHCVTAFALVVQHIVNDTLPATVRTILTTSCLVSLVKDDHGGRRPVAVGEIFYRLAARYALSRVLHSARKALQPHQFGLGEPDGCTQIVQSLQHLLTLPPTAPPPGPRPHHQFAFSSPRPPPLPYDPTPRPLACLSIDIANAFNSIDRAAVLHAAYANHDLAPCWRMLAFGYGQPSLLLVQGDDSDGVSVTDHEGAFIRSENGVRQGDPLAALLFSLAMHPVYARLSEILRGGCFAFMDDGHGVGYLSECWKAWRLLPELLAPLGLRLNPAKCELTCFYLEAAPQHGGDSDALRSFETEGVQINRRSLRVLGCVVGANDECVAAELRDSPKFPIDQRVVFRRLPLMGKQTGMTALRSLTGAVLTNRLRAMTPASTAAHAAAYDACVLRAAHRFVGICAAQGDCYDEQLRWPLGLGGFGLISAVTIAPSAYLAGVACTIQSSATFAAVWRGDADFEPAWPLYTAVADSIRCISTTEARLMALCPTDKVGKISKSVLPTGAHTFVHDIRALSTESYLLQSALTYRITSLSHIARLTQVERRGPSGHAELARLKSLTEKEASLWLRVLPTEKFLALSDSKWQWAARLRLGMEMPICEGTAALCEHTKAASESSWHPLCCSTQSSIDINSRHHAVVNRIAHFGRVLHLTPRTEPGDLDPERERRPDIQLDLPDRTLLADITISHPSSKKWRHTAASRGVEAVGDSREAEKDDLYTPMAMALDMEFCPVVLYTTGGFHSSALSFIRKLGGALDPATCLTSHTKWKTDLMQHIAVAVQRGNADIMIRHSARVRGLAWPTRRHTRRVHRRSRHVSGGVGLSGRRSAQPTAVGGEAGSRAAVLATRLFSPPPSLATSTVSFDQATGRLDSETVVGADSEAATVVQGESQLEGTQVTIQAELVGTNPPSSVEFVPESPLGMDCTVDLPASPAAPGTCRGEAAEQAAAAAEMGLLHRRGVAVHEVHIVNSVVSLSARAPSPRDGMACTDEGRVDGANLLSLSEEWGLGVWGGV
jgi:phage tail protein X